MQNNEEEFKKNEPIKFRYSDRFSKVTFQSRRDLYDRLTLFCERNGTTKTSVCVQALRKLMDEIENKPLNDEYFRINNGSPVYKRISFRCSRRLFDRLTLYCYKNHTSKTSVCIKAITQLLDEFELIYRK